MKRFLLSVFVITCFSFMAGAQNKSMNDSLNLLLAGLQNQPNSAMRDSSFLRIQLQLASNLGHSNHDTSVILTAQCLALAEKMQWKYFIAKSKYQQALLLQNTGNCKESNELLFETKSLFESLINSKDPAGEKSIQASINACMVGMANNYSYLGEFEKALQIHFESLKLHELKKETEQTGFSYTNIAIVYGMKGDFKQSLVYSRKALQVKIELKDSLTISTIYNNIANALYHQPESMDEAISNYQLALSLDRKNNNKYGMVRALNGLGQCYIEKGNYQEALNYLLEANETGSKSGNKSSSVNSLSKIGNCYLKLNRNDEARTWLLKSLEKVDDNTELNIRMALYDLLSIYYSNVGDFSSAYKYEMQSVSIKDTLHNEEVTRQLEETKAKYEYSIKETSLITAHEIEISKKEHFISLNNIESEKKQAQLEILQQQNKLNSLESARLVDIVHTRTLSGEKIKIQNNLLLKENELQSIQSLKDKQQKNFAITGAFVLVIFGAYILTLYSKRKSINLQLVESLSILKSTQAQLIKTEKEKEAEYIRLRISRDIHDDIGSNLTKIALLSDMTASDKTIKSHETIQTLLQISEYSRNVNNSLSEIVWAISPKQDTLQSLLTYMRNHIYKFLEGSGIHYEINFPEQTDDRMLYPDLKRNIFLVLKESLNNILKYAHAKNVMIRFELNENQFKLQLSDDGDGFDVNEVVGKGNGLLNMTYRMQSSGGTFLIESEPGKGCLVSAKGILNL